MSWVHFLERAELLQTEKKRDAHLGDAKMERLLLVAVEVFELSVIVCSDRVWCGAMRHADSECCSRVGGGFGGDDYTVMYVSCGAARRISSLD